MLVVIGYLLLIVFGLGMTYYFIICISFLLSWFRSLYGTSLFTVIMNLTAPFRKICCNRFLIGPIDIGATIGLCGYGYLLYIILNIANMLIY